MNKPPIEIDVRRPHIVRAFLILAVALLTIVIAAVELGAFRGLAPSDIGYYPPPPAAPYH